MAKSRDAFRTISEVSEWLETPAHVLRFWESRFNQIKPVKRAGGRRYYRPSDMLLLGGIKRLLHDDGITIKGVQKILREKGVKYVSSLSLDSPDGSSRKDKAEKKAEAPETTPISEILSTGEAETAPEPTAEPEKTTPGQRVTPASPQKTSGEETPPVAAAPARPIEVTPQTAEAASTAAADTRKDTTDERIVVLYQRLKSLRERVHASLPRS